MIVNPSTIKIKFSKNQIKSYSDESTDFPDKKIP